MGLMSNSAKNGWNGRDCDVTDAELVEMSRRGDSLAFGLLLARYDRRLRRWAGAYSFGWGDCEDVYQEANLGFLRAVRSYRPEMGSFATFARICVQRYLITRSRSSKTKKQEVLNKSVSFNENIDDEENDHAYLDILRDPNSPDPEAIYEKAEFMRSLVREASSCLSKLEFASFVLVTVHGYRVKEAAQALGFDWKKVDNAVTRARAKLANRLSASPELRPYLGGVCS